MAGEIQLNTTTLATESSGSITLSNVNSATNRTNLGLGSMATQAADSVSISGGNITGGTLGSSVVFPAGGTGNPISIAIIAHQEASATGGGTFNTGAWETRNLNTVISDNDSIVSLSSSQFTLAAGTYFINWRATSYRTEYHVAKLYDITGTADIGFGMPVRSSDPTISSSVSEGSSIITIASSNVYEIQHRCSDSEATYGFGIPTGFSVNNYVLVTIYRLK